VGSGNSNGVIPAGQLGSATLVASYGGFSATQMVTVISTPQAMTHRYSFWNGTANDTIGSANGTLHGTAVIEIDPFTGTDVLALDGTANCDMTIPAGTIDSTYFGLTVETWAIIQQTPMARKMTSALSAAPRATPTISAWGPTTTAARATLGWAVVSLVRRPSLGSPARSPALSTW